MHVAFSYHLVVVTYFGTNVGENFDANRTKIALAVSNSLYTWKNRWYHDDDVTHDVKFSRHYDIRCMYVKLC